MLRKTKTIVDEEVGSEQEEQEDALEDAGERRRQAEGHLDGFAAEEEERHQQPPEHDAKGVQPSDEGDDDGGKAVTGRDLGRQLSERAGHFRHTGDACRSATRKQPCPDCGGLAKPA